MSEYRVKLDVFEGPLDLLLHLIKEHELNIYDIPISTVTKQYFEYLDIMNALNLDIAGEFLVMASTLTYIKSRMLLPSPAAGGEEEEAEDPREELMRRLLEYKKYKEAAETLREREDKQILTFGRNFPSEWDANDADYLEEISVFRLLNSFREILEKADNAEQFYEIRLEEISITEKMTFLLDLLEKKPRLCFEDLFENATSRMELIGTFLAILELMKQQLIRVYQEKEFGKIWVQAAEEVKTTAGDNGDDRLSDETGHERKELGN
jgi:segregation and condensation protein A